MSEMTLSEAMRLGAMLNPQGFIGTSDGTAEGNQSAINGETTCALIAAHRAIGDHSGSWSAGWPWINADEPKPCPACDGTNLNTMLAIIHLNDFHRWTREQIADWVSLIERAQEPVIATEDQPAVEHAVELGALAQK